MKKLLILLVVPGFFVAACNNNKTGKNKNSGNQEKDDYGQSDNRDNENKSNDNTGNSGWTGRDKTNFLKECVASFEEGQAEIANRICPCVLQKMEKEYATMDEASTKGGEAAGERIALKCKEELYGDGDINTNAAAGWPQSERTGFITNCVKEAMAKGNSRTVAQNYCDCMLNKMEALFPDINDAAKLTEDDINSPEMKKLVDDCLREN